MEGAPLPFGRLDLEPTLMLVNDPVDRGEAQPVPCPGALVVKKGSKIWSRMADGMPVPVSATVRQANGPGRRCG
ncbi:MAG: hypothetical protein M5R38_01840 [Candidatus Methylomirabilis sp.]|nr:hypothetical protein [Candidatus Methylomirabilis sp.]